MEENPQKKPGISLGWKITSAAVGSLLLIAGGMYYYLNSLYHRAVKTFSTNETIQLNKEARGKDSDKSIRVKSIEGLSDVDVKEETESIIVLSYANLLRRFSDSDMVEFTLDQWAIFCSYRELAGSLDMIVGGLNFTVVDYTTANPTNAGNSKKSTTVETPERSTMQLILGEKGQFFLKVVIPGKDVQHILIPEEIFKEISPGLEGVVEKHKTWQERVKEQKETSELNKSNKR